MAYTKDTRLTIIDKEGNVLADSDKEGIQENHSGRSEFKEALSDQFGYATRYSSTVKKNMMYVAIIIVVMLFVLRFLIMVSLII